MAKHSESLKLEVVQRYLAGPLGYQALATLYGIGGTTLKNWVKRYRVHGMEGLRGKVTGYYSAEFKLELLRQAKRRALSNTQAAALFNVRGGSHIVGRWRRQYDEGGRQALQPKPRGQPRKNMPKPKPRPAPAAPPPTDDTRSMEALRKENEALRAEVAYLKKLEALVRADRQAAPKGRVRSSS